MQNHMLVPRGQSKFSGHGHQTHLTLWRPSGHHFRQHPSYFSMKIWSNECIVVGDKTSPTRLVCIQGEVLSLLIVKTVKFCSQAAPHRSRQFENQVSAGTVKFVGRWDSIYLPKPCVVKVCHLNYCQNRNPYAATYNHNEEYSLNCYILVQVEMRQST